MSKVKINENEFPDIVEYYNANGKTETYRFLRETYSLKNPGYILKRIERSKDYCYDPTTDKYDFTATASETSLFMSLDDLCSASVRSGNTNTASSWKTDAMEKLVHELIGDRLLELARYITISPANKTIIVDQHAVKTDGYTIILQ